MASSWAEAKERGNAAYGAKDYPAAVAHFTEVVRTHAHMKCMPG